MHFVALGQSTKLPKFNLAYQLLKFPLCKTSLNQSEPPEGVPGIFPQAPGEDAVPEDMSGISLFPGNAWLPEKLLEINWGLA